MYWKRNGGKMGTHARADYNPTLLYLSRFCSPAFHPNYKGKRVGRSFLLVGHISICLQISTTRFYVNRKGENTRKGEGSGWELTLSLNRHFMENGQSHAWVDLDPHVIADFNSRKKTKNFWILALYANPNHTWVSDTKGRVSSHWSTSVMDPE